MARLFDDVRAIRVRQMNVKRGDPKGGHHAKPAFHIVHGHFRTFDESAPLFCSGGTSALTGGTASHAEIGLAARLRRITKCWLKARLKTMPSKV